jgi:pyruvate formate-lyase activating enzyme-like uncharacterized protein
MKLTGVNVIGESPLQTLHRLRRVLREVREALPRSWYQHALQNIPFAEG